MALNTAEIARKAKAGIPLTNPTPESQRLYDSYRSQTSQTTTKTSGTTAPTNQTSPVYGPPRPTGSSGSSSSTGSSSSGSSSGSSGGGTIPMGPPRPGSGQVVQPPANTGGGGSTGGGVQGPIYGPPQPTPQQVGQYQQQKFWDQLNTQAAAFAQQQIAGQIKAYQEAQAQQLMLAQQQVAESERFLRENIDSIQKQNNANDFRIAENENRFGGTYSGGLRLQQAANDRSSNEAIGAATRDIQSRNNNIWQQYSQLAQQAQQKIADLSKQTPQLVQQYISNALQNAGAMGNLTGQTPWGTQTYAAQMNDRNYNLQAQDQSFNQSMQEAQFNYQMDRDARRDYESDRLYDYQIYRDNVTDSKWQREFEETVKSRAQDMGYKWASLNQREKEMIADAEARQLQAQSQQLQQGLAIFESTGQMPEWMGQYGINVGALNQPETKAEITGLYQELSSGSTTPEQALKRIDDAVKLGLKDSATAEELKKSIYMLYPEVSPEAKRNQEVRNMGINLGIKAVLKQYFGG